MRLHALCRAAASLGLATSLAACSGKDAAPAAPGPAIASFTADPPALFPGETVHLVAVFSGGSGSIEPDVGPVASGEGVVLKPGTTPKVYRLRVTDGVGTVEASLPLAIAYRHRLDPLPAGLPRADHAAVLADGRVLLAGGLTGAGFEPRTELWDPAGGFSLAADLATPHAEAAVATDARGTVLVTGGLDGDPVDDVRSRFVEAWTPGGGWRRIADMLAPRHQHTATPLADGTVLLAGGEFLAKAPGAIATEELYDAGAGTTRRPAGGPMAVPRYGHTATPLADGTVLLAGGRHAFTGQVLASAELYDPATETFTPAGGLLQPRASHVAARLPDGRVLLAGGDTAVQDSVATAEIYDPVRWTSAATGPMRVGRAFHAAAPLATGEVLVAGGLDADGVAPDALEVYDPATGGFAITARLGAGRLGLALVGVPGGAVLVHGGRVAGGAAVGDAALYR